MGLSLLKVFRKEPAPAEPPVRSKEANLFQRFLEGDDTAAIKLFQMYNSRLYVYCSKIMGSTDQAEDVVQEVWERVIKLRAKPLEVTNPVGFLFRIARNLCINHIKVRSRTVPFDTADESLHPADTAPGSSELEELVLSSLDSLKFEDRELLVLNAYCGYKLEEIAEMLGISPNAVWTRASRARARLRTVVMEMMNSSGQDSSDTVDRY